LEVASRYPTRDSSVLDLPACGVLWEPGEPRPATQCDRIKLF